METKVRRFCIKAHQARSRTERVHKIKPASRPVIIALARNTLIRGIPLYYP